MKIRIKFKKFGAMKFVGHLDLLRYFQKAMRRADIDMAYSQGFSPHPIMSFASPLGVGITSDGEYLDIEVRTSRSQKTSEEAIQALNETMVEGITILEYKELPEKSKNAMSLVAAADYTITFDSGYARDELDKRLYEFWKGQDEILITKLTKRGSREMDLKPLIYELKTVEKSGDPAILMKLSTGSTDNVKPEMVMIAFFGHLQEHTELYHIHRNETYAKVNGAFVPLGAI